MKKVITSLMACAALCACSTDEASDNGKAPVFGKETAYLNVRICDAAATRAVPGTGDNEFQNGSPAEYAATDAHFYFYDSNKAFVAEANVWKGGDATQPNQNIEFNATSVVVLRGLTEKTTPKYMVTVLNTPTGFVPGATLDEMLATTVPSIYNPDPDTNTDLFVMSTTSVAGQTDAESGKLPYFVTEVAEENFTPEPETLAKPVVVFVERLAAKVTVNIAADAAEKDEQGRYKLNVTVAGNPNDVDDPSTDITEGATDLSIEFVGWALNGTAKKTYMMKNINEEWTNDDSETLGLGDWIYHGWNSLDNHRSYWGMSWNYGKDDYPADAPAASENEDGKDDLKSKWLSYVAAKDIIDEQKPVTFPVYGYCPENTNTAAIAANRTALTSVLLIAKIHTPGDKTLVRYNGILYDEKHYLTFVPNTLTLNAWYANGTTEDGQTRYTRIDEKYLELANLHDGRIYVKLKAELPTEIYSITGAGTSSITATKIEDYTEIDTKLQQFNKDHEAFGYKGGLMYYNIPIEHLRPLDEDKVVREANYGVVRNHHYVVTINSLTKLGKGIYDPDEVIIPDENDQKETYYVGAQIHILSWKLVNQGVEL